MAGSSADGSSADEPAPKVNTTARSPSTPRRPTRFARAGIDRLIRFGIGLKDDDHLIACLNWPLHHEASITPGDLDAWRAARTAELGLG